MYFDIGAVGSHFPCSKRIIIATPINGFAIE
jgi:hypothetical protein